MEKRNSQEMSSRECVKCKNWSSAFSHREKAEQKARKDDFQRNSDELIERSAGVQIACEMSQKGRFIPAGMEDEDSDDFDYDYERTLQNNIKKTTENLKITIVPDITSNAALNGSAFDATLTPDVAQWLENLRQTWNLYKKGAILTNMLKEFYASRSNPFVDGLKLYANSNNRNASKANSLAYIVIEELHSFTTSNRIDSEPFLDDNIKMVAFNFGRQNGQQTFFRMLVAIYNLIETRGLFVDKIRDMIREHNYKDACQIAHELQLHNEFEIFDFIFPLILQDKISTAEMYLEKARGLQRPLIELLDSLLDRSSSVQNICEQYAAQYNYKELCLYKLQPKTLSKLIKRLAKVYNLLDSDALPNVMKSKKYGQVQFLLHKNFYEKSLSKEAWQEMVLEIVPFSASADLKMDLIQGCCNYRDSNEAAHWARHFNIPTDKLPIQVQELMSSHSNADQNVEAVTYANAAANNTEDWDDWDATAPKPIVQQIYHSFDARRTPIIMVDSSDKFFQMLAYLSEQFVIAFDAEWKPISCSPEVALIQLATNERVYLVDVILIDMCVDEWNRLATHVFNNVEILKLGYSHLADLKMFQKTMPAISLSSQMLQSYLDLQIFWQKLDKIAEFKFPFDERSGDDTGKSLSNLVQRCVGHSLDKSNQFSNWENRPLRNEQISYAALDAFCLLEIYGIVQNQCERSQIEFNDLVHSCMIDHNKKKSLSKKTTPAVTAAAGSPLATEAVTDETNGQSPPRKQYYYRKQPNHQLLQREKQQPQQH